MYNYTFNAYIYSTYNLLGYILYSTYIILMLNNDEQIQNYLFSYILNIMYTYVKLK